MTYAELKKRGADILKEAGIAENRNDAGLLLEYVCGVDRNFLFLHGDDPVKETEEAAFWELLQKRKEHVPLQHLTQRQFFMGFEFQVNENVLVPRPDTEILVEEVLKELHDKMTVLDMCTGSGCILISLLGYSNGCFGVGADVSEKALQMASENAEIILEGKCRLQGIVKDDAAMEHADVFGNFSEISFVQSDLFENIRGKYDRIVSNPPYIKSDVIPTLMPEVRDHDPHIALDGGTDGLAFYKKIIEEAPAHLNGGGMLYFEIGFDQAGEVRMLMEKAGFQDVQVKKDYGGNDRVIWGTLKI